MPIGGLSAVLPPAGLAAGAARVDNIQTVKASSFAERVLNAPGPVAVEFMSYACGHCRLMEPAAQQAAAQLTGKVKFFRVNVGADPGLAEQYGIGGTPTFVMFKNGHEVGRSVGPNPTVAAVVGAVSKPFPSVR